MKIRCKFFIAAIIGCGIVTSVRACHGNIKMSTPPIINYEEYDIKNNPLFATYDNGEIYITKSLKNVEADDNDIVIIDLRDKKEDMQITSSYRIGDIPTQLKVIDVIIEYNNLYPSDTPWIRSKNSLLNEWIVHNIAYYCNYERTRSESVDFENSEEETYNTLRLIKKPQK